MISMIKNRYLPVVRNSGFKMKGYYIWCGSCIKGEDGRYYMFAARWPEKKDFPNGYMTDSEIVLASTDSLDKPFKFEKVIIGKREGGFWDSIMAHNPFIMKVDGGYVMYYIGTVDGSGAKRVIGYAYSKCLTEDWKRSDKPLNLPMNSNNPACVYCNGKYLMYYRDGRLKVSVAESDSFRGPFRTVKENLFPQGQIEDMFVFRKDGKFVMYAEDAEGAYTGNFKSGVRFVSDDGINWDQSSAEEIYDFKIEYDDGENIKLQRRERPFILFDDKYNYLFNGAKIGGKDLLTGGTTWNMVQRFEK